MKTREEQRQKHREQQNCSFIASSPKTIKRLKGNKIVELTPKQNRSKNKREHKAPIIFFGQSRGT